VAAEDPTLTIDVDVSSLSVDDLVALLGQVEVLQARILVRLVGAPAPAPAASEPAHYLTAHEAAALRPALGLKTIRFLTRTQRVPSVLRGRRRLLRLSDIDSYVDTCRRRGVALGVLPEVTSRHAHHASRRGPRHPPPARPDPS
jgi:hypothetical protein